VLLVVEVIIHRAVHFLADALVLALRGGVGVAGGVKEARGRGEAGEIEVDKSPADSVPASVLPVG